VESLHARPIWTGLAFVAFTAGNVVTLILGGQLADSRGRRPLLIAGCGGCALGCGLLALADTLPLLMFSMAFFGLASGLLDIAPGAVLGDVGAGRGGTVVAAYQMTGDAGSLMGPLIAGAVVDAVSFSAAFGLTAGILVLATGVALLAPETLRSVTS
jgi:MFS family permease